MPIRGYKHTDKARKKMSKVRREKLRKGKIVVWNKGKTKETDERIKKYGVKISRFQRGRTWNERFGKERAVKRKGEMSKRFSGKNHYNWQGGISFEPYSVDWTETLRRSIRERDHYICQLCSKYGDNVHHIDYDKKNCNPTNLINLCRGCNARVNIDRKKWAIFFNLIMKTKLEDKAGGI